MTTEKLTTILSGYAIDYRPEQARTEIISSGLINPTWKITSGSNQFILQRINIHVFSEPEKIARNLSYLAEYAIKNSPDYLFVAPLIDQSGHSIVKKEGEVYRLFPFIKNSHTINSAFVPEQAYQAAFQFGKFTHVFAGMDVSKLNYTIPNFHNLSFRYREFIQSLKNGNQQRIQSCAIEVKAIEKYSYLVAIYESIVKNTAFKLRVTHHDTKISNVLFDQNNNGLCVIDLDTVMPGYFISDVGDMMRTYLSEANEEEKDVAKINIRKLFFEAILKGFLDGINGILSSEEMNYFFYSGPFIVYMQAIRFLTDYFNNDTYYQISYSDQNWMRAKIQLCMLSQLIEREDELMKIIR